MATYADITDVANYVTGDVIVGDSALAERLLKECERELDQILKQNQVVINAGDRKINPSLLLAFQAERLKYATCAQFEYHVAMGEDFFVRPQPESTNQPNGVSYKGRLPIVSPKALRELEGTDLLRVAGRVEADVYGPGDPFWWQRASYGTQTAGLY